MRVTRVVLILVLGMLSACTKSPTKPVATDPYSQMYGTWEGQMNMVGSSGYFGIPDSVRLVVAASGATPTFQLWQRKLESAGDPWPWRTIAFTPTTVSGCPCSANEWDGVLEAECAPDTASDASRGSLGFGWPTSTWHTQFWPNAPRSGSVTKMVVYRQYPSPVYSGYDLGYTELSRR